VAPLDRHQRDHARVREIDVLDLLSYVVQHHAALERDRSQVRGQQGKVVRRQRRQESVEFSVLQPPGNGGRAVWTLAPAQGGDASPIKVRQKLPLPIVPCVQPIDPPVNESACKKKFQKSRWDCHKTSYRPPGRRTRWGWVPRVGFVATR